MSDVVQLDVTLLGRHFSIATPVDVPSSTSGARAMSSSTSAG